MQHIICLFDYLGIPDNMHQPFISLFCSHKQSSDTYLSPQWELQGGGVSGWVGMERRTLKMKREVVSLYFIRPWCVTPGMIASLKRFRERSVNWRKHMAVVFSNIVHGCAGCTNVFSAYLRTARQPFITTARLLSSKYSIL